MAPAIQPLYVAMAAGILLIASIGIDAAINRTIYLEFNDGSGWKVISQEPYNSRPMASQGFLKVDPNGTILLRLRIDNGFPWGNSESYRVTTQAGEVAQGTISVEPRSEATAELRLPAGPYFDNPAGPKESGGPTRSGSISLTVEVGKKAVYGYLTLQEASS